MGRIAGKFDRVLIFERGTATSGVGRTKTWAELVRLRGKRMPVLGGASDSKFLEDQELPDDVVRFECRWYSDIDKATDRVTENGVVYSILDVDEFNRKESLRLVCKKWIDES